MVEGGEKGGGGRGRSKLEEGSEGEETESGRRKGEAERGEKTKIYR